MGWMMRDPLPALNHNDSPVLSLELSSKALYETFTEYFLSLDASYYMIRFTEYFFFRDETS